MATGLTMILRSIINTIEQNKQNRSMLSVASMTDSIGRWYRYRSIANYAQLWLVAGQAPVFIRSARSIWIPSQVSGLNSF